MRLMPKTLCTCTSIFRNTSCDFELNISTTLLYVWLQGQFQNNQLVVLDKKVIRDVSWVSFFMVTLDTVPTFIYKRLVHSVKVSEFLYNKLVGMSETSGVNLTLHSDTNRNISRHSFIQFSVN